MVKNKAIIRLISLFFLVAILISTLSFNTVALNTTINVTDGRIGDWTGVPRFNDSFGDANGVGPNDLTKLFVTNDGTNLYVRWDVILSGSTTMAKSCSFGLAITSQVPAGTSRPAFEVMAYVAFDATGNVKSVELENASKEIKLPLTYAEQISSGTALSTVSIEAKFPFADFNNNSMTATPLTANTIFPVWGCTLQAAVYNSNQVDTVPDTGFLKYDSSTSAITPVGTGPVASMVTVANNPYVSTNANVYYTATIRNTGDGATNLAFTTLKWQLPAGFTYVSGSTTGITTSNPTISSGLLTWTVAGSLAAGASTTLNFTATAPGTVGTYYSDVDLVATTPNVTYDNGATAVVYVGSNYTPITLTASSSAQTSANLSWTAFTGATKYRVYENGVLVSSDIIAPTTTTTITGLTAGSTHTYTVKAYNQYNEEMAASNTASVTTVAPYNITVANLTTNDNTPTITGTTNAPNGSTVRITVNAQNYNGSVSGGLWSADVTNVLADNTYSVSAVITSGTSNTGNGTLTVDTVAPTISVNSLSTQNRTPTITGTTNAPNGRTVTITVNGQQYTGLVSGGAWSILVTNSLSDNTYTVGASVSDLAGNVGTGTGTVIIDNVPPTVTVNSLTTRERTPTVTGTTNAPNGSTVTLTINGQQYTGEVQNGSWSIHIAHYLADNTYTASVSITDPAGNAGTGSGTVIIDNEPPVITVNSLTTKDRTPTVTGTTNAADGSTVTLTVNGQDYTTQSLNGSWSVDVTQSLADNTYSAGASVYDAAGNEGTATGTIIIDNVAPVITVNSLTTNHTTPTITGSADTPNGSVVTITVNGVQYTGEVLDGSWSILVTNSLSINTYTVDASVSDAAGNTGTNTGSLTVTREKSSDANLISIVPNSGTLSPLFSIQTTSYTVDVVHAVSSIALTSVVSDSEATIKVNGASVASGSPSGSIPLSVGQNVITVEVTAENGIASKTYTVTVTRAKDASLTEFAIDTSDIANKNITLYGANLDPLYVYQIWCYQYVIDEFNVNEGPSWVLAKAYNVSMAIDELGNSSYTFKYDGSPFDRCKIFVRIKDLNGNISTYVNEYSVATNTKVKINNVKIDNVIAVETFYKAAGSVVNFKVDATPAQGSSGQITYSYYLNKIPVSTLTDILTSSVNWEIPFAFHPGKYELMVRAYQDGEFDEKIINLFIKNNNFTTPELIDNCISIPSIIAGENHVIAMLENALGQNEPQRKYSFSFREPMRTAFYSINQKQTNYTFLYPGYYQFTALINYEASSTAYTDGAIRNVQISRNAQQQLKPAVKLNETTLTLNGDIIQYSQAMNLVNVGDTLVFNASALNPDNTSLYEYSFFRLDAKGDRLVKDYDNALNGNNGNILTWKPESPGVYRIQVRARLKEFADSASNKRLVSYEDAKSYTFTVQGAHQKIETVTIELNGQLLSKNPIQITATCPDETVDANNLLYRFESYDKDMTTITLADYSPLNTCEWVPRKAGEYKIRVLVRDKNSYGYYDKLEQTDNIVIANP